MDNIIESARTSGSEFPKNQSAQYRVVTNTYYQPILDDGHDKNQARDRDKSQLGVSGDL